MSGLDAAGLTLRVYRLAEDRAGGDVEQAARALGVAPQGLYRILAITETPDLEVLAALVRVWHADAVWLLTGVRSLASDDVPAPERVTAVDVRADITEILEPPRLVDFIIDRPRPGGRIPHAPVYPC